MAGFRLRGWVSAATTKVPPRRGAPWAQAARGNTVALAAPRAEPSTLRRETLGKLIVLS
jgi:hypothetical protein